MDVGFLLSKKKMLKAQSEREMLQMLDHPFLPTLYAHFTENLSCLVMEYCPCGDLHVQRQKQPGKRLSEPASRFYVAEVLVALEYLYMLGMIYRNLKLQNILERGSDKDVGSLHQVQLHHPLLPSSIKVSNFMLHSTMKNSRIRSELVMELTNAHSNSSVGTHEYLTPEIIKVRGMEVLWVGGPLGSSFMSFFMRGHPLRDLGMKKP